MNGLAATSNALVDAMRSQRRDEKAQVIALAVALTADLETPVLRDLYAELVERKGRIQRLDKALSKAIG